MIGEFMHLEVNENKEDVMIFPRFQQLRAVRKMMDYACVHGTRTVSWCQSCRSSQCPLMATNRHSDPNCRCPMFTQQRTSLMTLLMSGSDPKRTLARYRIELATDTTIYR